MNQATYFIQVQTYKSQWQGRFNELDTWLPTSIAGVLAIMTFTAIISYAVKR